MKILLICIFLLTGCTNTKFLVCGVDIKEVTKKDVLTGLLGGVTALAVHIGGHYLAAEVFDIDITQVGTREVIQNHNKYSSAELEWFARGGFILQLGINTVLVYTVPNSYFVKGYTTMTNIELITYSYRYGNNMGDFYYTKDFEYPLYVIWARYLDEKIKMKGGKPWMNQH